MIWGAFWDPPGSPKCSKNQRKTFFVVSSFFAKSTSRRPEPQDPPRSDFWLILAHPSKTFLGKQRFRVEGVRHGTFADAHPPRENLVFTEKLWKGVPKSTPGSILGRFWHSAQTWLDRGGTWLDRGVRSRPDRPRNAIAQPDRPEIDRKKLHRPARSTSTSSEQLSSTTNSTISRHDQETSPLGSRLPECALHTSLNESGARTGNNDD